MCFLETKSEIVVPIKFGRRVLGVIDVESDHSNAFGPKERVLLEQVSRSLAMFLSRQGKYLLRRAREAASPSDSTSKPEEVTASKKRPKALATVASQH
jgi:hypothetical protein